MIPGALPQTLVGLRQSLGIAWLSLIVAETISARAGLGYMINHAREFLQTDVIVVGLAVYSLLGLATDAIVRYLERKALAWRALNTPDPRPPSRRPSEYAARVTGHNRSFGDIHVLRSIDLDIQPGEFVVLLGRSGCGKSTLLRSLAHLDPSRPSEVQVTGRTSVAFQEPRLLPWRRVRENVELALLNTPRAARPRGELAEQTLDEVGLTDKLDAWPLAAVRRPGPAGLAGPGAGEQPVLLLLDEPFSALDALTRIEMHQLVIELWRRHAMAILLVTHDVDEALALADRVVADGRGPDRPQMADRPCRAPTARRRSPRSPEPRAEILEALGVKPTAAQPATDSTLTNQGAA